MEEGEFHRLSEGGVMFFDGPGSLHLLVWLGPATVCNVKQAVALHGQRRLAVRGRRAFEIIPLLSPLKPGRYKPSK